MQQTIKKNKLTQSSVIFIRPSYGYLWSVDGFHTHPNHVKTLQSKTDLVVGAIHRNDETVGCSKKPYTTLISYIFSLNTFDMKTWIYLSTFDMTAFYDFYLLSYGKFSSSSDTRLEIR